MKLYSLTLQRPSTVTCSIAGESCIPHACRRRPSRRPSAPPGHGLLKCSHTTQALLRRGLRRAVIGRGFAPNVASLLAAPPPRWS